MPSILDAGVAMWRTLTERDRTRWNRSLIGEAAALVHHP
jgi:predicted RNA polymerase sigma factor